MEKLAIITGASSGLGAEFAKALAHQSYRLLLIARREDKLKELAQSLQTRTDILSLDLTQENANEKILNYLETHQLQPSLLINCAGFGIFSPALDIDVIEQEKMIDLNVKALTKLTLSIAALMKKAHHGQILNIASIAAFCPCPNFSVYGATKAYVLAFSENLASELRPYGVTVTALCPGPVRTPFWTVAGIHQTQSFELCMSEAKEVVHEGLQALHKQKSWSIAGAFNKGLYALICCLPRRLCVFAAELIMNKILRKTKKDLHI